jgi:hypothetical protein
MHVFQYIFLSMYHVQNVETTYTVLWSNVDQKWTYQVTLAKPAPQKKCFISISNNLHYTNF